MREQVEPDVRDYMHDHPGEALSPGQVAEATGHRRTSVSGALGRLAKRPAEGITCEARGCFRYGGRARIVAPLAELALGTYLEVIASTETGYVAKDENGKAWRLLPVK